MRVLKEGELEKKVAHVRLSRGKEEDEWNFKGKGARTASHGKNAYTCGHTTGGIARKNKDRASSNCPQGSFTSNLLTATCFSAMKCVHPSEALKK